ncbi:hypothetical protein [uncultured Tenacibaculum sp.]|uniref:hypothetical protein n=1 Tax=uncultured Tenacibaculum sp. TaxID=174713 RepID=UPI0026083DC7|nr:hypothetical protein [uncultured Tenacibaculum sp.]
MKNQIFNLGKLLSKTQQQKIKGSGLTSTKTNGCGNRNCGTGCGSNQICVQVFCGPFDIIASESVCIDIV